VIHDYEIRAIQDTIKILGANKILHDASTAEYFESLYLKVFPGEPFCTTCPGVIQQKIGQILNLSTTQIKFMADRKYKMGPGIIDTVYTPIPGVPVHVTNANLTDEVAEKLLKANPNYKNQIFKVDGEPVAPKEKQAETETLEDLMAGTKPEIIAKLESAGINFDPAERKEELAKLLIAGK
jgi:hypothetical protein